MNTNTGFVLALIVGAGLAGCGSGSRAGADSLAAPPDGATAGAEAAVPADASYATEVAASPDMPAATEAAILSADVGVDSLAAPLDVPSALDSLTDAEAEAAARMDATEVPGIPDAAGFEAAKPDAVTIDIAATDLAPATLGEISAQQLHIALANKDFLLIDVHTPNAGSIPGTDARIAYDDIPALVAFIGPDLDTKVVLTCLMGGMSKSAGNALVALGYRNISELTGGMSAWTAAGYSLVHLDGGL
ncbi:MAG: rhodanese-like domain-containing protein [Polyangia bacterium]